MYYVVKDGKHVSLGGKLLTVDLPYSSDKIDTSDATATAGDIVTGKTAYVNKQKLVGTHTCGGSLPPPQSKTVTPTKSSQNILADDGYHLSAVIVNPIPNNYITTDDANAVATDIAEGKIAYVKGVKVVGTHKSSNITTSFDSATGTLTITEV